MSIPGYATAVFRSHGITHGMTLVVGLDRIYDPPTVDQLLPLVNQYLIQFFCAAGTATAGLPTHQVTDDNQQIGDLKR